MEPVKARLGERRRPGCGVDAVEDDADEPGEIFAFAAEDFGGYGVAFVGAAENELR